MPWNVHALIVEIMENLEATPVMQQSYLNFKLGEDVFAVNVSQVSEIIKKPLIKRMPYAPGFMTGVINVRGRVLPVLDIRMKFGVDFEKDTFHAHILVVKIFLEGNPVEIGALVDSVEGIMELPEKDIEPLPGMGSQFITTFIKGMVRKPGNYIVVMDINNIFSELEISQALRLTDRMTDCTL
jgi:purine-binding chemotaxis protein CheW